MQVRLMCVVALSAVVLMSASAGAIPSAVPQTMNYQVMLTDDMGDPLPGPHELIFRLYEVESGGSDIWIETHNVTANSIGVVSVVLGSDTPLTESFAVPYWIEVEVDGEVMSPRRELTSAPYALRARDADQLGGATPDEYATDDELSTIGIINTVSNPVDWTKLKNVPAGIADGIDDTAGAGDGYSLDASDGSPVDALYVNSVGDVGIGTTSPTRELQLYRPSTGLVFSHFTNGTTGVTSLDGLICGINGSGNGFLWNYEAAPISFGIGGSAAMELTEQGVLELGNTAHDGQLEVFRDGTTGSIAYIGDSWDDGASFYLNDASPSSYASFEPDYLGLGGAWVNFDAVGSAGLTYDGNFNSEPRLALQGSVRSATFTMSSVGDASVSLPTDAISSAEMLNEPGAANLTYDTTVFLSGGVETVQARSITSPASGYILAIATAEFYLSHVYGTSTTVDVGLSDFSTGWPTSNDVDLVLPSAAATGTYRVPVTVHGFFETTAGSKTIYLLSNEQSGVAGATDINLTLIYLPTAYGTVEPDLALYGGPDDGTEARSALTASDLAIERSESEAANQARIDRELEEMRARLAELESQVNGQQR